MKAKVLVCVLCGPERYQWPHPNLMLRLIETGQNVQVATVFGAYGYDLARNRAVEMFLRSDADWLCMIDNDIVPPADFVPRVMQFAHTRPDVGVVPLPYYINPSGSYPLLAIGHHNATQANLFDLLTQLPNGWQEIEVAGCGCMFIRREVLATLKQPCFRLPDYAIRQHGQNGVCEDFAFCEDARAAGFHIWTHGGLMCSHFKTLDLTNWANTVVVRNSEEQEIMRRVGLPFSPVKTVRAGGFS